MKITMVATSIMLLSSTFIASETLPSNTYRASYDAGIKIPANSLGYAEEVIDEDSNLTEFVLFDYAADKWNESDPSAEYEWIDHSHSCIVSRTNISISVTHGVYQCWRVLGDRSTRFYKAFNIHPEDDFDIAFNVYRSGYGSNYQARAYMEGDGHEVFYWIYDRLGTDFFRTPVGQVNIVSTANHRYRIEKKGGVMRMYLNGEVVGEGEYQMPHSVNLLTYVGVNNSRMHFSNLSVKVYRPD